MKLKLKGKIIDIQGAQKMGAMYKKRGFVIDYVEHVDYPECITFEVWGDRCDQLDELRVGQEVEVSFDIKGKKWVNSEGETRYFNSLRAWRIEPVMKVESKVEVPIILN